VHVSSVLTWEMQERRMTACSCVQSRQQDRGGGRGGALRFTQREWWCLVSVFTPRNSLESLRLLSPQTLWRFYLWSRIVLLRTGQCLGQVWRLGYFVSVILTEIMERRKTVKERTVKNIPLTYSTFGKC